MPQGNYPMTKKNGDPHPSAGLSKNKYDAKGKLRPARKSRSKIAPQKATLGFASGLNPIEEYARRKAILEFALTHYDEATEEIWVKEHLEVLIDTEESVMSGAGALAVSSFEDDYLYASLGADQLVDIVSHPLTYDIDQPHTMPELKEEEEEALPAIKLPTGGLRQRAERSDAGKKLGKREHKHLARMKEVKADLVKSGNRLGTVKGIYTETAEHMFFYDEKEQKESGMLEYLEKGEERMGTFRGREPLIEGRFRSDPTEKVFSLMLERGMDNVPLSENMKESNNPYGRKLGTMGDEGDGDYSVSGMGGINFETTGADDDQDELSSSITDDFIHSILFEGKNHPDRDAIINNLNQGKKFDLAFDALANPYMVKPDAVLPTLDTSKTIGATSALAVKPKNFFHLDHKAGLIKMYRDKKLGFLTKDAEGVREYMTDYNARRAKEEAEKPLPVPSMTALGVGGQTLYGESGNVMGNTELPKVYVGEKDPATGKVRKRRDAKLVDNPKFQGFVNDAGTLLNPKQQKKMYYGGPVYTALEAKYRGAFDSEGKPKWFFMPKVGKMLILYGTNKKSLPTASNSTALPVPGWSKDKTVLGDFNMRKAFMKVGKKYMLNLSKDEKPTSLD